MPEQVLLGSRLAEPPSTLRDISLRASAASLVNTAMLTGLARPGSPGAERRWGKAEVPALRTTLWPSLEKYVGPLGSLTPAPHSQDQSYLAHVQSEGPLTALLPLTAHGHLGDRPSDFSNQSPAESAGCFSCQKPCMRTDAISTVDVVPPHPQEQALITPPMFGMCTLNTHNSLWGQVCN